MLSTSVPVRRTATVPAADDRPLRLPHWEIGPGTAVRFLGESLDPELFGLDHLPLWEQCSGDRLLQSWDDDDQARLLRWHRAGLIVVVPQRRPQGPDLIVVSPHPDDAQLALGGLLSANGGRIVDVFSDETWTRRTYYQSRPRLTADLLIAEERASCAVLHADLTLLGHRDGVARPAWSQSFFVDAERYAVCAATEPELFERLVVDIRTAVTGVAPILTPLAIGGHVDHILTREAVLASVARGDMDPARIVFYEDMPYALFADAAAAAATVAGHAGLGDLRPVLITADATAAACKREALWPYRLQVTEGIIERVIRYAGAASESAFAERIWVPAASDGISALDKASPL